MRTGEVEANPVKLNEESRLPYIADLIERKVAGGEKSRLDDTDIAFYKSEYRRLWEELQSAHQASLRPQLPGEEKRRALDDLLVRFRIKGLEPSR